MTRDDPTAFAPPPAFGPFRVLHQIGVGALGPVIRTYEPTRDRLVAVKVFRLDITPEQAQALADELSRAADAGLFHPSIVEPIAAGVEGTVAYRAEEYVAGESMDVAIRHYAPAPLEKVLPILTQLAGAIDFARAAGVGHGALHLRDIFVTPDEARASGFGVVDALERVGLRAPVRRPYTAPERIAGQPWSTPADVFSLAAITYELLTGRRPAGTGDQIGLLTGDTAGAHASAVRAALARAMDDEPGRRYSSALGFASALEAAARGEHVTDALRDVSAIAELPVTMPEPAIDEPPAQDVETTPPPATDFAILPRAEEPAASVRVVPPATVPPADDGAEQHVAAAPREDRGPFGRVRDADDVEIEPARPGVLFDDESPADAAMKPPPLADTFRAPALHRDDAARVVYPRPEREPDRPTGILAPAEPEPTRSKPALPLAMMLILGLLIGFAGAYVLYGRRPAPGAPDTATQPSVAERKGDQSAATAGRSGAAGQEFSEQAIAPPAGRAAAPAARPAQPAREAPPVPGDTPPAATAPPARTPPAPVKTTGSMTVRSTPSRASVTVNGRWRGRTPLTIPDLRFGSYNVRVVQPGYDTAREDVTLSAADPARTLSFRLERAAPPPASARPRPAAPAVQPTSPERGASYSGVLYVDSLPRGAAILVDGKRIGTTPARIPDMAIGSHVVRLELPDHRAWTTSTRVAAGQETRVTGSLERIR